MIGSVAALLAARLAGGSLPVVAPARFLDPLSEASPDSGPNGPAAARRPASPSGEVPHRCARTPAGFFDPQPEAFSAFASAGSAAARGPAWPGSEVPIGAPGGRPGRRGPAAERTRTGS